MYNEHIHTIQYANKLPTDKNVKQFNRKYKGLIYDKTKNEIKYVRLQPTTTTKLQKKSGEMMQQRDIQTPLKSWQKKQTE